MKIRIPNVDDKECYIEDKQSIVLLVVVEYKQYKINMTIFNKYYMIVIEQGGEWLWQKVQNIHRSLKKMQ